MVYSFPATEYALSRILLNDLIIKTEWNASLYRYR